MKLDKLRVKNFRSIKELELAFPKSGILVLVGANNAGKSNVIRAIDAVCGDQWFSKDRLEGHDHYLRDPGRPIEIRLTFDNRLYAEWKSNDRSKYPTLFEENGSFIRGQQPKEVFPCIYLAADRTFNQQMQFYDWTLIGRIRKAFHKSAHPHKKELEQKFEEVVKVFDKIGEFVEFKEDFSRFFEEMQADTSAKLAIDFKPYTPSNYFKTLQILATDSDLPDERLDLEELGEGSRNMILLALLRSYAKNFRMQGNDGASCILALEEPELYMHPQARRHLAKVLRDLTDDGVQVIVSTHSSSFVDTERFDSIGRVVKLPDEEEDGRTYTHVHRVSKTKLVDFCIKTGVPKSKPSVDNISEFYAATSNAALNEAFFARCVVLVEGDTEELALPVYLSHARVECDRLGISIISVGGKGNIPKYWRLFGAFEIPMIVVVDNDKSTKPESNAILASCFGLKAEAFLEADRVGHLISNNGPHTPILVLEENFERSLQKDFEASVWGDAKTIPEAELAASALIKPLKGQSKGQIARFVARQLVKQIPEFRPTLVDMLIEHFTQYNVVAPRVPGRIGAAAVDEPEDDFMF